MGGEPVTLAAQVVPVRCLIGWHAARAVAGDGMGVGGWSAGGERI